LNALLVIISAEEEWSTPLFTKSRDPAEDNHDDDNVAGTPKWRLDKSPKYRVRIGIAIGNARDPNGDHARYSDAAELCDFPPAHDA
jgi:hypothetical protein